MGLLTWPEVYTPFVSMRGKVLTSARAFAVDCDIPIFK
jgi:hypothetical protein